MLVVEHERYRIELARAADVLVALEATPAEVAAHAEALAAAYNEPHNRAMMATAAEMTAAEVVEYFALLAEGGSRTLGLARVYVTILPENAASLRLFDKLGYLRDESPEARAHVDHPTDVSLSL